MSFSLDDDEPDKPSLFSNPFAVAFAVVLLGAIAAVALLSIGPIGNEIVSDADGASGIVLGGSGDIVRDEASAATAPGEAGEGDGAAAPLATAALEAGEGDGAAEPLAAAALEAGEDPDAETLAIRELSALDESMEALLGGRIVLVSSREPGVVVLEDGQRFPAGAEMPNGHVIAAIERERLVLERDGVVSVIRLP